MINRFLILVLTLMAESLNGAETDSSKVRGVVGQSQHEQRDGERIKVLGSHLKKATAEEQIRALGDYGGYGYGYDMGGGYYKSYKKKVYEPPTFSFGKKGKMSGGKMSGGKMSGGKMSGG